MVDAREGRARCPIIVRPSAGYLTAHIVTVVMRPNRSDRRGRSGRRSPHTELFTVSEQVLTCAEPTLASCCGPWRRSCCVEVVPDGVDADEGAGVGGVDHVGPGDRDADVGDRVWAGAEEHQIAGQ